MHCRPLTPLLLFFAGFIGTAAAATIDIGARGALADDGRDDAPAIQAAINAAVAGDIVAVPPGRFHVASGLDLKGGVRLLGAGRDVSALEWIGGDDAVLTLAGSDTEVAGLLIDGAGRGASTGVFATNSRGHRLHDLRIERLTAADALGIRFTGAAPSATNGVTDSEIADCVIREIGTTSTWGGGIRLSWGSSRNRILRCTIDGTGRGGIFANDSCTDLVVRGNTVTRSGLFTDRLGIELWGGCHRGLIEDNRIDHWLSLDTSNQCALRRNTVSDATGWGYIGLEVIAEDAVVTDNRVDGGSEIGLSMSNTDAIGYHFYANNVFQGCRQWGCQLFAEGGGIGPLYFYRNTFAGTRRGLPGAPYPGADGRGFFCNDNGEGAISHDLVFEANEFIDNGSTGLQCEGSVDRITAFANRFTGNAGPGVSSYGGSEIDWRGNTVSGNASNVQPTSRGFADRAPTAAFFAPANAAVGDRVAFVGQSTDSDGSIVHTLWDFGAGLPNTEVSPSYTYTVAGTYRVTLIAWDDRGRASRAERTIVVGGGGGGGSDDGDGALATYYSGRAFNTARLTRVDERIDFDWGGAAAQAGLPVDRFSVRWTAEIVPRHSEEYEFITTSDDGVRLWIDDQLIIDQWTNHPPTQHAGLVRLIAGRHHRLRMEFFENYGGAVARLEWRSASQAREVVPRGRLHSGNAPENGDGVSATYFADTALSQARLSRVDQRIDFDWGGGAPAEGIGADRFSVRWQAQVQPRHSEEYTFTTTSDDGIRLWVDGQLIIDQWNDHAPTQHGGRINLTAGSRHELRVEFYENGGGAVAKLEWSSASQPREIVPRSCLYRIAAGMASR